jgi:DNA repair ATPase RecN
MRLPVPGPRDVLHVIERGADSVEQLLAAVPRVLALLSDAETLLPRVHDLLDRIEETRVAAQGVVERTDRTVSSAQTLLTDTGPLTETLRTLLEQYEPPLTKLQPVVDRLAETTEPHEVDAMVELIDHLPQIADKFETSVMPMLETLRTVAPDLHDLLDVSRELNEMLGQIPGVSRMKKRIDAEQEAEGRG